MMSMTKTKTKIKKRKLVHSDKTIWIRTSHYTKHSLWCCALGIYPHSLQQQHIATVVWHVGCSYLPNKGYFSYNRPQINVVLATSHTSCSLGDCWTSSSIRHMLVYVTPHLISLSREQLVSFLLRLPHTRESFGAGWHKPPRILD